jgi:hypothetical protein
MVLDRKPLAFFRDQHGKSAVHLAIEKLNLEIATYLLEKYPFLSKMNDCVSFGLFKEKKNCFVPKTITKRPKVFKPVLQI